MAYNEKELEQMITVIKNLKKERNEAKNPTDNGDNKDIRQYKTKDTGSNNSPNQNGTGKDTSFYSRIFHGEKDRNTAEKPKKDVASLNINSNVRPEPTISKSDVTKKDIEEVVKEIILDKIENQEFMKEIITTIIKEYNSQELQHHIVEEIRQQVEGAVGEQIDRMLKDIMHQIGEYLLRV